MLHPQRYNKYSHYLLKRFACRVRRACLDPGLSCPNLDGTVSRTGCLFCDRKSFTPTKGMSQLPIAEQLKKQIERWERRHPEDRFIAYFQNASNTFGPTPTLLSYYRAATEHPKVVGLAIATRPDCLDPTLLRCLEEEWAGRMPVSIELGLQIANDDLLRWLRRGHDVAAFRSGARMVKEHGLEVTAHVILGLPGQTQEDLRQTALLLNEIPVDAVKIHSFYVARRTALHRLHQRQPFALDTRESYVDAVLEFLEYLHPSIVIQRLLADVPETFLEAPTWISSKASNLATIEAAMDARDTWQGRRLLERKITKSSSLDPGHRSPCQSPSA